MALDFQVDEATAAQRRFPLYLVDAGDGITAETGEAAGQPQVSKNGAAFGNTSATLTAIGNGSYYVELTAGELDTLGMVTIRYKSAATAEFSLTGQVVSFDPYDATPPVDVTQWNSAAVVAPNTAGVPVVDLIRIVGGLVPTPTTTGVPDVNVERWLDTLVTLSGSLPDINVEGMDANSIAVGVMAAGSIGSGVIAAAELTNIENEIWDALKSAHVVANSFGDFLDIEVSSRMAEASIDTTGGAVDVVTAITNAVTVGTINANVINSGAIATDAIDADALASDVRPEIIGALGVEGIADAGGSTSTIRDAALTQADDFWIGHYILFTSGPNLGRIVRGTDFDATLDDLTFAPTVGTAVGVGDTYIILGSSFAQADVQTWLNVVMNALVSGAVDADVSALQANVITAASINTAAIDADAIAANAIGSSEIATDAIGSDELATTAVNEIRDAILPTQNVAFDNIEFLFVAASDHVTPVTAASGTAVTRSIDGGGFAAGTGTLAEVGNGIYQYDASSDDMNGGIITFRFTASGGTPGAPDDRFLTIVTGGGV